jgi:hypothetical protein
VTETCYRCDKLATYTCDATGCNRRMCQDHSVLTMLGGPKPAPGENIEAGASHTISLDHAHLCLDHAPSAHL